MSAYSDAVLADTPFLYWRFGESSGLNATDSSGNARHGFYHATGVTYSVTSLLPLDTGNTCVTFNGTTGEAHSSSVALGFPILTVEFWMSVSSFTNDDKMGVELSVNSASNNGTFYISPCANTADIVVWMRGTSGSNYFYVDYARPSAGAAHHYVFVLNMGAKAITFYLDGVAQTGVPTTGGAGTSGNFSATQALFVASRGNLSAYLSATMDEFALYTSELSQARVTAHYWAGKPSVVARLGRDRFRGKTRLLPA
jgi:hypothetical protein